jgi:hypothetical protein
VVKQAFSGADARVSKSNDRPGRAFRSRPVTDRRSGASSWNGCSYTPEWRTGSSARRVWNRIHDEAFSGDCEAEVLGQRVRVQSDHATDSKESFMSTSDGAARPRIARIWRGRTTRDRADEYAPYLYETGIRPLEEKALGVQMFREDRDTESEFVTISYWESVEAMSRFAGDDPKRIHHLERDPEFLIELPKSLQILDVVAASGLCTDN